METQTPMEGVTIAAAMQRTGYTVWQIRGLIRRNEIRHCKRGKRLLLHPEDVNRLEQNTWSGKPVEVQP